MARNVYVTAMEPGSGKSAVVLGMTEVLSRNAARLAFYRPFIASADVPDAAVELIRHRYRLPQTYAQSFAFTRYFCARMPTIFSRTSETFSSCSGVSFFGNAIGMSRTRRR